MDEHVTPAHLQSVRAELDAKVAKHRAEVDRELGVLAAELRANTNEQTRNHIDVKLAIDGLSGEVAVLANTVDGLDDRAEIVAAVHAAMRGLKRTMWRVVAVAAPILVAIAGVVVALLK